MVLAEVKLRRGRRKKKKNPIESTLVLLLLRCPVVVIG
jgi:hypothetical protein